MAAGEEVTVGELAKRVFELGRVAAFIRAGEELGWETLEIAWRSMVYGSRRGQRPSLPDDVLLSIEQAWRQAQRGRPGGVPADRSVPEIVAAVAREHSVVYKRTMVDDIADKMSELSGDDVPKPDETRNLLLRLAQRGLITRGVMGTIHAEYLRARAGRE